MIFSPVYHLPLCPSCGATRWSLAYTAPAFDAEVSTQFSLARCMQCGLVRTAPALSDEQLGSFYATPYYGGSGQKKFTGLVEGLTRLDNRWRAHRLLAWLRRLPPSSTNETIPWRILDIGCGRAHLLAALAAQGCECHGVERQEFPMLEIPTTIHFHRGTLDALSLPADYFDAVVLWHSLEHVNDPAATLQNVARLVRPGGLVAIAVPNFGSWQAALFNSIWFHLDLPRHIYHLTDAVLQRLLQKYGLQPLKIHTWTFDQSVFGFIQSTLNALARPSRANALYALLKNPHGWHAKWRLLGWLTAAGLIAPLALVEYLLAGLLGRGASLIIYARKIPMPQQDN